MPLSYPCSLALPPGEWLSAKDKRLSTEAKTQAHLQKVRPEGLACWRELSGQVLQGSENLSCCHPCCGHVFGSCQIVPVAQLIQLQTKLDSSLGQLCTAVTPSTAWPCAASAAPAAPSAAVDVQVIEHELEFISKQAKGQQAKGRARQRRYEDLVAAANSYVKNTQVGAVEAAVRAKAVAAAQHCK